MGTTASTGGGCETLGRRLHRGGSAAGPVDVELIPPSRSRGRCTGSRGSCSAQGRGVARQRMGCAGAGNSRTIDEEVLAALDGRRRVARRSRHRRLLWHAPILMLGAGLFAYGVIAAPPLCLLGYLILLGERLVPPASSMSVWMPHRFRISAHGALCRHVSSHRWRCRPHWRSRPGSCSALARWDGQ